MKPREFPRVSAKWLAGLLSGEDFCRWSLWARAHYWYDKTPDSFDFVKWRADHGEMVRATVKDFEARGYTTTVERQNKFEIKGRACLLAGQVDVLALVADGGVIGDCKTGRRKPGDVWQVRVYQVALPLTKLVPDGVTLRGLLRYRDGDVEVPPIDQESHARILAILAEAGSSIEPARTPSASECRFCELAACPDRVTEPTPEVVTGAF